MRQLPVVFANPEEWPRQVLKLPVVLLYKTFPPNAELYRAVVDNKVLLNAFVPNCVDVISDKVCVMYPTLEMFPALAEIELICA